MLQIFSLPHISHQSVETVTDHIVYVNGMQATVLPFMATMLKIDICLLVVFHIKSLKIIGLLSVQTHFPPVVSTAQPFPQQNTWYLRHFFSTKFMVKAVMHAVLVTTIKQIFSLRLKDSQFP